MGEEVTDAEILEEIKKIRDSQPNLGWKKVMQEVNKQNGWELDLNRGKVLMKENGFVAEVPPPRERKTIPPKLVGAETLASPAKKQKSGLGEAVSSINPFLQSKPANPYLPTDKAIDEQELKSAIERVKKDNPDFGVKRVAKVCQERWPDLGHRRVKQIMKDLGMVDPAPQHANKSATMSDDEDEAVTIRPVERQQAMDAAREKWEWEAMEAVQKGS